jgi:hypothetical protein
LALKPEQRKVGCVQNIEPLRLGMHTDGMTPLKACVLSFKGPWAKESSLEAEKAKIKLGYNYYFAAQPI